MIVNYISFDRAADFYDATRGHPPGVSEAIARSIQSILPEDGKLLEIGIGTGRISRPLLDVGMQVYGLDVSRKMLARLLAQLPGGSPQPRLVLADAAWIPMATRTFDAVLAVHVFHLIGEWQQALEQIQRVLKPEGCLLAGYDWREPDSIPSIIADHWHKMIEPHRVRGKAAGAGVFDFNVIRTALAESGARLDESVAARWTGEFLAGEYIDNLAQGCYSSSWSLKEGALRELTGKLRKWVEADICPLDQQMEYEKRFILQRFHWE